MTGAGPLMGILVLITGLVVMAALTYYVSKRSTTHYVPLNWEVVTFPGLNGGRIVYSTWERLFYPVFNRVDAVLRAFLGQPLGAWEFAQLEGETDLRGPELKLALDILVGMGWLESGGVGPPGRYYSLTPQGAIEARAALAGSRGALWGRVHEGFMDVVSGLSVGPAVPPRRLLPGGSPIPPPHGALGNVRRRLSDAISTIRGSA
jgi:hypothetical protein